MQRFRNLLLGTITVVLGLIVSGTVNAQDTSERRHAFRCSGINSPAKQKQLTELLRGFDPEMVVSVDETSQLMKLLTTVQLDIGEVRNMCSLIGVQLQPVQRRDGNWVNE
ncbi:MAG: hypothetical protein IPJ76_03760 [Flavobacteriales bacterium]|nr:MAG: hypothetical protein IPJ76_03760 [Flavobacteriales bacterium]